MHILQSLTGVGQMFYQVQGDHRAKATRLKMVAHLRDIELKCLRFGGVQARLLNAVINQINSNALIIIL